MRELEYGALENEITGLLAENGHVVLSTCAGRRVTSRTVCYVSRGTSLCLLTGRRTTKYRQMEQNPAVALCMHNLQMEGEAVFLGPPALPENEQWTRLFAARHPQYYARFAHFKVAALVRIDCRRLTLWKFEDGRDRYFCLDTARGKAITHT